VGLVESVSDTDRANGHPNERNGSVTNTAADAYAADAAAFAAATAADAATD
jgi:hypothetical protein